MKDSVDQVRGDVLLKAQTISLAKVLAANDKSVRDKGIKRLYKWITARSSGHVEFTDQDLMTIWKGLFYCMWMSDKPLVQEELAERISNLIHCFKQLKQGLLFMESFFRTLKREWFGIDQLRLDKFMMLVRRCLRQLFVYCASHSWPSEACDTVPQLLEHGLTSSVESSPSLGLLLHTSDVILEELAKAKNGEQGLIAVLRPWAALIANSEDARVRQHVTDRVFHHLIRQSPLGIEFQERFEAWKQAGFPGNSWRDMEPVEDGDRSEGQSSSEEDNTEPETAEQPLDPRAGKVDVELPTLEFDGKEVAALLRSHVSKAASIKQRKALNTLASQFSQLAMGQYPLGFKKPAGSTVHHNRVEYQEMLWQSAEDLVEFEQKLIQNSDVKNDDKNQIQGKKRKLVEDTSQVKQKQKKRKKSRRRVTVTEETEIGLSDAVVCITPKLDKRRKMHSDKSKSNDLHTEESVIISEEKENDSKNIQCPSEMPKIVGRTVHRTSKHNKINSVNGTVNSHKKNKLGSLVTLTNGTPHRLTKRRKSHSQSDVGSPPLQNGEMKSTSESQKFERGSKNLTTSASFQTLSNSEVSKNVAKHKNITRSLLSSLPDVAETSKKNKTKHVSHILLDTPVKRRHSTNSSVFSTVLKKNKQRKSMSNWIVTDITENSPKGNLESRNGSAINTSVSSPALKRVISSSSVLTPSSAKKVNIVLKKNMAQDVREYHRAVKKSPEIPFDANKKPIQSVLKATAVSSPINPFYKLSKKIIFQS